LVTQRQLLKRVKFWQRTLAELGISHWRIEECNIVEEPPTERQSAASCGLSRQYASVWFNFRREFLEEASLTKIDETIVHEWLHVALRDLDEAKDGAETWMPAATWTDFEERYTHESEGVVEAFARLIVRLHG
jgi:hypothetical protein